MAKLSTKFCRTFFKVCSQIEAQLRTRVVLVLPFPLRRRPSLHQRTEMRLEAGKQVATRNSVFPILYTILNKRSGRLFLGLLFVKLVHSIYLI